MRQKKRLLRGLAPVLAAAALLSACGGGKAPTAEPARSTGQVAPPGAAKKVSYYAAARFADQASFGATPELIAEIQAKGFEKWIDDQFALPPTRISLAPYDISRTAATNEENAAYRAEFPNMAIAAPDQLRLRVTWALSQFIVVSDRKVEFIAVMHWINLLQDRALGRYDDLLHAISVNPAMGYYLDNNQNRPKSAECMHCAPNENFARELLQLFSLGVFKLNSDGTPVRDAQGRFVETYTQRDVEELARVLTGWMHDPDPPDRPSRNWGNWAKPMVPSTWAPERDSGAKTVLGRSFPAGQSHDKDLRDAIAMLMQHQNIAPFVAIRMIQQLVKSNPSPAYVGRVAAVFRDNGSGVAGDMKAVVKAVLLDPEARAGDDPASARPDNGKLREPFLYSMAVWRGLGCDRVPRNTEWNYIPLPPNQQPFNAESVFSFYAPTDRAPGSNLLAPEQRLINAQELTYRLNLVSGMRRHNPPAGTSALQYLDDAGCEAGQVVDAYSRSPREFNDWLSARFFRGAMPPTLRGTIEQLIRQPQWNADDPTDGAMRMVDYALAGPYFGAIK